MATKTQVTIDGLSPTDGTGTIYTYTDMNSSSTADTIGIRSVSSVHVTVQKEVLLLLAKVLVFI